MDYNNMEVVMIGSDQNMPDEKMPAKLIKVIEKTDKKNHMRIKIIHPNKDSEGNREVLYDKVHRFSPEKEDPMELFLLAQKKGDELIETQFANVETTHEDIKFIPAYKTGFMKMNTKKSQDSEEKKEPKKTNTKKVTKKTTIKNTSTKNKKSSKKVAKKKVAKKVAKNVSKKKVAKKVTKNVSKKKVAKKVTKKVAKKKVAKKVAKKTTSKANSRRKKVKK